MSVNSPERSTVSEEFEQKASHILNGDCYGCPLYERLSSKAEFHDGIGYDKEDSYRRLGGFLGAVARIVKPAACNGQDCLTPTQLESSDMSTYELAYDEAAAARFTEMALESGDLSKYDLDGERLKFEQW
jgi:hypothetical protein